MAYGMSMHSHEILLNPKQCQYVAFRRHKKFLIQNASAPPTRVVLHASRPTRAVLHELSYKKSGSAAQQTGHRSAARRDALQQPALATAEWVGCLL
jgi:hypothetical protein